MYYPYLYGKRHELLALRAMRGAIGASGRVFPVIEPVNEDPNELTRAVEALSESGVAVYLVVNPGNRAVEDGNYLARDPRLVELARERPRLVRPTLIIHPGTSLAQVKTFLSQNGKRPIAIMHGSRYKDPGGLAAVCKLHSQLVHLFPLLRTSRSYQQTFPDKTRIRLADGFSRMDRNADYPEESFYSDAHLCYQGEGFAGFGDWLIVGETFRDTGGPARAVAIHLTHDLGSGEIMCRHFVSDDTDAPVNPGGKYLQALKKLVGFARGKPKLATAATREFADHLQRQHYPGLGVAKQLSMEHHLELMCRVLK